jgi:hypothetical protein
MLMPTEDFAAYEALVAAVIAEYWPVGSREQAIVEAIVDADWRIRRIPMLEAGIFALGELEFAPLYPGEPEQLRQNLIRAKTSLAYKKVLRNLKLQAAELRRHREEDVAELRQLQANRRARRAQPGKTAANSLTLVLDAGSRKKRGIRKTASKPLLSPNVDGLPSS